MSDEPDSSRLARDRIQKWMREVMRANDWTANQWAAKAGTAATNLTRFLGGHPHIPTAKTLAKLGAVAYSSPPVVGEASLIIRQVRLVSVGELLRGDGRVGTQDLDDSSYVATTLSGCPDAFAFRIHSDSMSLSGIMSGDVVIVAPGKPAADKICLAIVDEDVACYLFKNGLLIPKSANPIHEPVIASKAKIIGVVRQVVRELM